MGVPLWKYGGTLNGRIDPVCADAQGVVSLYYYGGTYFYSYVSYAYLSGYAYDYSTESDHVFLLGEDTCNHPEYRYSTDDTSYVEQTIADLTDIDVVYFTWRLRESEDMPTFRTLSSASIEFKSGLGARGDGAVGIVLPKDFTTGFTQVDHDRLVTISGSASNDGTYRIAGVPWDTDGVGPSIMGRVAASPETTRWIGPGDADPAPTLADEVMQYKNGQVCVLEDNTVTLGTEAGVTLTMPGARWIAKCYVDDILRTELKETRRGRSWQRNSMAAFVSNLSGNHTLKFELSVELETS